MNIKEKCMAYIDSQKEEGIKILRDLVGVDSTTGNEEQVQAILKSYMESCGFDTVKTIVADKKKMETMPQFIDSGFGSEGRPNVIGVCRGSEPENGKSLMFLGHMDSVPVGNEQLWSKNPRGELDGDKYYGRGAWDMKSGMVSALLAMKAIKACGAELRGDVKLCGSVEEEKGGGLGALAVFDAGESADAVLVAEPVPIIVIACAGVCYFKISFIGKAAHGGRAHMGVNVIEKMCKVYEKLMELDTKRWTSKSFPLFEAVAGRSCNINISVFSADGGTNVPDYGYLLGRASSVPGETMQELRDAIVECTKIEGDKWLEEHPPVIEWVSWQSEPWYQDESHPFVKTVKTNADSVFGRDVEFGGKACGLDARFCGQYGMPAVSIGADGGNMHGVDEFVSISSMIECAKLYASVILDWCV